MIASADYRNNEWATYIDDTWRLSPHVTVTMGFIGNAQYLGEDLHIHCERADLMLRHDELWVGHDGRRTRLAADEPDSNPVSGLLDTMINGEPDRSPPESALNVFDMTQAILASGHTKAPVRLNHSA